MRFTVFIFLIVILGCSERSNERQNIIIEQLTQEIPNISVKRCFSYNLNYIIKNDSSANSSLEICFDGDSVSFSFDIIVFKTKHLIKNDGLYINNILTHSFSLDSTVNVSDEIRFEPIINQTTKLVDTKSYLIENKTWKVLKFYENYGENSHSLLVSYYLDNGIPLIISKYYSRSYLSIENEKYLEIVQAVVQDDDYFEIDDLKPPTIE